MLTDRSGNELPYYIDLTGEHERPTPLDLGPVTIERLPGYAQLTAQIISQPAKPVYCIIETKSQFGNFSGIVQTSADGVTWTEIMRMDTSTEGSSTLNPDNTPQGRIYVSLQHLVQNYLRIQLHDRQNVSCEPLGLEVFGLAGETLTLLEAETTVGPWQQNTQSGDYEARVEIPDAPLPLRAISIPNNGLPRYCHFSLEVDSDNPRLSSRGLRQPLGLVFIPEAGASRFSAEELASLYDDPYLGAFRTTWVPKQFYIVAHNTDVQQLPSSGLQFYIQHNRLYFPGRWDPPLRIFIGRPDTAKGECAAVEIVALGSLDNAALAVIPHFQGKAAKTNWLLYLALAGVLLVLVVFVALTRSSRRTT